MAEEEGGAEDTSFLRTVSSDHVYYFVDDEVDVDDEDTSFLRTVGGDHVVVYDEVDEGWWHVNNDDDDWGRVASWLCCLRV